jgi:DnaK suppressor protein
MTAKKTASKKRNKTAVTRKKVASRRSASRGKTTGTRGKVSRKKASRGKSSKKKVASKKKTAKKAAGRKKVTRKKVASKKPAPKKKKKTVSKNTTGKKVSKKKAAKKKVAKKKTARKKAPGAKKASVRKKPARRPARRRDLLSAPIHGIAPYTIRRGEEYMSKKQLSHFEKILTAWKRELMDEVDRTVHHMQDEAANFPDPNDRATQESEFGLELRTRDRERKLLRKIDAALTRIEDGSYGFCDETGEEIGLKRLEARPVATLCVEAQERREMAERQFRDRDDRYR